MNMKKLSFLFVAVALVGFISFSACQGSTKPVEETTEEVIEETEEIIEEVVDTLEVEAEEIVE
jgi:CHASE3 domain sensor protein